MVSQAPSTAYAGDVDCRTAWNMLNDDPAAQLIDVRTQAEWAFVGMPDLSALRRQPLTVEWQSFPSGQRNAGFVEQACGLLRQAGGSESSPVLLLCRSGGRSRAAAMALTGAGFTAAFNVAGGFEGDPDEEGHRGTGSGWKAAGLPWRQS